MTGHIDPTRDQFNAFKGLDRDHPIDMLNLVALNTTATYPEGHALADAGLSGQHADGLGLAETTPGPLILVTEFVGFQAVWAEGGWPLALAAARAAGLAPPEDVVARAV